MARKKNPGASIAAGLPVDYANFLESLKTRVRQAQTKAMLSVNQELIRLYWDIGREIVERQEREGWGKGVVDQLAGDIQRAFPGIQDYLDLLFYHLKLRCFVVIDLKMKKFTPADAGQMNYYLSAVDSLMKHTSDAPSIGLILCRTHDRIRAE